MQGVSTPDNDVVSFPRLFARTLRFTLGIPRDLSVTADGSRVLFVRTSSGTSRTGSLWEYGIDAGSERCLADPADLFGPAGEQLSDSERARRERSRESGAGIVGYNTDRSAKTACFALSGKVWLCDIERAESRELPTSGAAIDPRLDPTGSWVAYAADGAIRLIEVTGENDRALAEPDGPEVAWGLAEFAAAEEMNRYRGFWWAPDGQSLLVERYDNAPVPVWHIADPANPEHEPVRHRYPVAGAPAAEVQLWHLTVDGTRTRVGWDDEAFPYLTSVSWSSHGEPVLSVMSRDQTRAQVLSVELADGSVTLLHEARDDAWVDVVPGVPAHGPGKRLITCVNDGETRKLAVDGAPVSPDGLQLRSILAIDDDGVLVSASSEPTEIQLARVGYDGATTLLTEGSAVHHGAVAGGTAVIARASLEAESTQLAVYRDGAKVAELRNLAEPAGVRPQPILMRSGSHDVRTAVFLPRDHESGSVQLPVVMSPYGGPHGQQVLATSRGFLEAQWLADQGFCVIVADGRGTPARGPGWERAVKGSLADVTLQDQVDALAAVATAYPGDLDTSRVGIIGWSFGGYLAALAVLDRPDVFHAAVAGAPVTEWRLYDAFYTERYLGDPTRDSGAYDRSSLLPRALKLERELLIIHGMVDDNVTIAHSLRLSSALLAAGRPHRVLPLTGVTHMTPQEVVAENLKLLQVDFLQHALR